MLRLLLALALIVIAGWAVVVAVCALGALVVDDDDRRDEYEG